MSTDLAGFWVHTITVKTYLGSGTLGAVYAPPVEVACFVDDKRSLVRDGQGAEIISETTVYAPVGAHALTPESLVTLPSAREATVITVAARQSGDLALPDHIEAALT
jgi:hypothetical protein